MAVAGGAKVPKMTDASEMPNVKAPMSNLS